MSFPRKEAKMCEQKESWKEMVPTLFISLQMRSSEIDGNLATMHPCLARKRVDGWSIHRADLP